MLSDMGIRDYLQRGLLGVEPLGKIGPASIDLRIGDRLYRSDSQAWLSHQQEVDKLAHRGTARKMIEKLEEPGRLPFDKFVSRFAVPAAESSGLWILEPNEIYYAQTAETVKTKRGVRIGITTRSSAARNGLGVQFSDDRLDRAGEFAGKVPLVLQTYGTCVELPKKHSMLQLVVEPSRRLTNNEIRESVRKGEIAVSGKPEIRDDAIYLTFHPTILRYNGRPMNPAKDSGKCFEPVDITRGYALEPGKFYLASTREVVRMGTNRVGVIDEMSGGWVVPVNMLMPLATPQVGSVFNSAYVHMNAPYHWPGSDHSVVLEIFSSETRMVRAGMRACRMFFEELYPETGSPYNSRYSGQTGPTLNRV
ncbi:MAG: hypothetical protein HYS53_02180 [Candidatus Aenigmarchaeota archaeon]|nr:hypothetical protein [Candidatus Aenigmarchaeota archaeon]